MLELILKKLKENEESLVLELNNKLKHINKEPSYLLNKSIPHAKYNSKENLITINNENVFESIIHEQLHAILIYRYNFPSIAEITILSESYNLLRQNHLIMVIYNDFHHFVFFLEFRRITKNNNIIVNERQLLYPKLKFDFLKRKFIEQQSSHEKIKAFYEKLFIPYKYKNLINKGTIDWDAESLSKLDNDLFQLFNNLFDFKIDFSIENRSDYQKIVVDKFSNYFQKMNEYLFPSQLK